MDIYRPRNEFEYDAICALKKMIETGKVSSSYIQRAVGVGWHKGIQILDWLKEMEFVVDDKVVIDEKQFKILFGDFPPENGTVVVTDDDVCARFLDNLTGKNGPRG